MEGRASTLLSAPGVVTINAAAAPLSDLEACRGVLARLLDHYHAPGFSYPIDAELDSVPDYAALVRHPMDLYVRSLLLAIHHCCLVLLLTYSRRTTFLFTYPSSLLVIVVVVVVVVVNQTNRGTVEHRLEVGSYGVEPPERRRLARVACAAAAAAAFVAARAAAVLAAEAAAAADEAAAVAAKLEDGGSGSDDDCGGADAEMEDALPSSSSGGGGGGGALSGEYGLGQPAANPDAAFAPSFFLCGAEAFRSDVDLVFRNAIKCVRSPLAATTR